MHSCVYGLLSKVIKVMHDFFFAFNLILRLFIALKNISAVSQHFY